MPKEIVVKVNKEEWDKLAVFILPWIEHEETGETIEQYYNMQKEYHDSIGMTLMIPLYEVLAFMMFMSEEQIVVYPQDQWQYIEFYFNNDYEPVGYNIVPKLQLT